MPHSPAPAGTKVGFVPPQHVGRTTPSVKSQRAATPTRSPGGKNGKTVGAVPIASPKDAATARSQRLAAEEEAARLEVADAAAALNLSLSSGEITPNSYATRAREAGVSSTAVTAHLRAAGASAPLKQQQQPPAGRPSSGRRQPQQGASRAV